MEPVWLEEYPPHAPHTLAPANQTLAESLIHTSTRHPEYIAMTFNGQNFTYAQLNEKVNALAHAFQDLGLEKGDRLAFLAPNSPTYVIAFYAAMKLGLVVVNINLMAHGEELKRFLNDSGARLALTLDIFAANLYKAAPETGLEFVLLHSVLGLEKKLDLPSGAPAPLVYADLVAGRSTAEPGLAASPRDLAVLQYTSGATGAPKAAMLTHASIMSGVLQSDSWIKTAREGNLAYVCVIPFFHVFGLSACMHLSVLKGYRMLIILKFDAFDILPILDMVKQHEPVGLPAVPSLWTAMLSFSRAGEYGLEKVDVPVSGGAPLPEWVGERFQALTGRPILEAYGLSEASGAAMFAPWPGGAPAGSVGLPLPGTLARIVDLEDRARQVQAGQVGELAIKGPQLMEGYYHNPELTRAALADGWLYTGDLVRMDEKGYFYLVDRRDDLIITNGFNVYPSEVETVLASHPAVAEAAVVGAPDRLRGQAVKAYVRLKDGAEAPKEELKAFCRERLAAYKTPKTILLLDSIPKSPVGKPLKKLLDQPGG